MKPLCVAFLIMASLAARSVAECAYFRVSTKLLDCAAADSKTLHEPNPYSAASEIPEFVEENDQKMVQIHCECEYSLQGSDQRCDMDQTIERSSVRSADDPANSCRRGQSLCREVCPARLP